MDNVVKTEKPQKGNPRRLTFWQHVFPAKSIERFAGHDGKIAVRHRQADKEFKLAPENELFCAQRRWDQRAEAGYMKEIEDQFQSQHMSHRSIPRDRHDTKGFWAIWCVLVFSLNAFGQMETDGTIIVFDGSEKEFVIAADGRTSSSNSYSDSNCKISTFGNKVIFTAQGRVGR